MATIVTQYDPWREKLAANLGIGLLSDALSRGREADANRKNNALYTKTLEDLGLLGEQTQQFADPLMNSQPLPEGYNDNGWAKTMHDSYTPMTQFNMGTAGLTEPAPQPKMPTQMDMMRALAANIAGPRFNMVNFNDVYTKMFQPTMDTATADYATQLAEKQRAMQQQFSDALFGAGNRDAYGRVLNAYLASGYAPKDVASAMQKNYEHMFPNFGYESVNLGNRMVGLSTDPITGNVRPVYDWGIGLSPDKAAQIGFDYAKLGEDERYHNILAGQNSQGNTLKSIELQSKMDNDMLKDLQTREAGLLAEIAELEGLTDEASKSTKAEKQAELASVRAQIAPIYQRRMFGYGLRERPQWTAGETVSPMVRGHSATINKWAQHYGVDPDLLATVMQIESNGNPNMNGNGTTVSKAGARGVMQVMPKTAENLVKNYGLNPDVLNKLDDTDTNVMLGALLLSELQRQYGTGNLDAILGAYNGGGKGANPKTRVDETRKYVAKGNAVYQRLKGAQPPRMAQYSAQQKTAKDNSPVKYVLKTDKGTVQITEKQVADGNKEDPDFEKKLLADGAISAEPSILASPYISSVPYSPRDVSRYVSAPNSINTAIDDAAPAGEDALFGNSVVPDVLFHDVHNDYSQYTPEQLKHLNDMAMYYLGNEQEFLDPLTQSLPLKKRSPFEGVVPYPLFFGKPLY